MVRVTLTNEIPERITSINEYRLKVGMITLPPALKSRFRKIPQRSVPVRPARQKAIR